MIHHHTVDRISFIARDALDQRAFSYIYSSGDNLYHLFAIKTEAAVNSCFYLIFIIIAFIFIILIIIVTCVVVINNICLIEVCFHFNIEI